MSSFYKDAFTESSLWKHRWLMFGKEPTTDCSCSPVFSLFILLHRISHIVTMATSLTLRATTKMIDRITDVFAAADLVTYDSA